MPLKSLDLLVALELASGPAERRSYADLGRATGMSASEAHQATRRGVLAGLLAPAASRFEKPRVRRRALLRFLEHGLPHVFFALAGRVVRGVPTAHSAPPLRTQSGAGRFVPACGNAGPGERAGARSIGRANPREQRELIARDRSADQNLRLAREVRRDTPVASMNFSSSSFLFAVALAASCTQPKPRVLCTLENPATRERLEMYEEIWFKVPRDYDEARHIAHWKERAAERGFTREVPREREP